MRTNRISRVAWLACLLSVAAVGTSQAGGLSTQLGEAMIENLQVGQTYDLQELANLSLTVSSGSDYEMDLLLQPLVPESSELKQGAEAIPDLSWIALEQDQFVVAPKGSATTRLFITIPDDDRYLGRKFQATVWSHTVPRPGAGMAVAYGLKSRILFTVSSERIGLVDRVAASVNAGCLIAPGEIRLEQVTLGKLCDLEKESGVVLTVSNPGARECKVKLMSQSVADSHAELPAGYEDTPDATYLTFSDNEFTLAPGARRSVQMYLRFPSGAGHRGSDYVFIIHAQTEGEQVQTGVYSRLYASVK